MRFDFVDAVIECSPERIVTLRHVSAAEEYLQDHFPTYPVLPGVMMLEAMAQAARRLLERREPAATLPFVLGGVRALKYGRFVRPGGSLRVEAVLHKAAGDGLFEFKGEATLLLPGAAGLPEPDGVAASGRFTMRPASVRG